MKTNLASSGQTTATEIITTHAGATENQPENSQSVGDGFWNRNKVSAN